MERLAHLPRAIARRIWSQVDLNVLACRLPRAVNTKDEAVVRHVTIDDVDRWRAQPSTTAWWRSEHRQIVTRLAQGERLFVAELDGRPVHRAWLQPAVRAIGSDFGRWVDVSDPIAVLWDDHTEPEARGRGLHRASIAARVRSAERDGTAHWAMSTVRSDNAASMKGYLANGFVVVATLTRLRRCGLDRFDFRTEASCPLSLRLRPG